MKLYIFPRSARALGVVALKKYLTLDCEVQPIDLGRGDQLTPQYLALNPNKKMPTLEDDGFALWESLMSQVKHNARDNSSPRVLARSWGTGCIVQRRGRDLKTSVNKL